MRVRSLAILALCQHAACIGNVGDPSPPGEAGDDPGSPGAPTPGVGAPGSEPQSSPTAPGVGLPKPPCDGPASRGMAPRPLRRFTTGELTNTLTALLGPDIMQYPAIRTQLEVMPDDVIRNT